MPYHWPSDRFKKAAHVYREDFETLLITINDDTAERTPLFVEKHLGVLLGQAIRFHLRTFFNPVPFKVMTPSGVDEDELTSKHSRRQSRITEIVKMTLPDGVVAADSAVADGSISSVVSMALQVIYAYFGADAFLSQEYHALDIPGGFCNGEASQRGICNRNAPLTQDDVAAIVSDVEQAQRFLDAARACQFLSDLMDSAGVREEIAQVGGWERIESHANKILSYGLSKWCPDDAHLVVLGNAEQFLQRVGRYKMEMQKLVASCEQSLAEMGKRFNCKNKGARKRNKVLCTICSVLEDGKRFTFPQVAMLQP